MIAVTIGRGLNPDVRAFRGRLWLAYHADPLLRVFSWDQGLGDPRVEHEWPIGGGAAFPRWWDDGADLWLAYRGAGDLGVLTNAVSGGGQSKPIGPVGGTHPFAFGAGVFAWRVAGQTKVYRIFDWTPVRIETRETSQGLDHIEPDGRVVYRDDIRRTVPFWGTCPTGTPTFTVVESPDAADGTNDGVRARIVGVPGEAHLWAGMSGPVPHGADDGVGRYAVCVGQPVRVAILGAADMAPIVIVAPPSPNVTIPQLGRRCFCGYIDAFPLGTLQQNCVFVNNLKDLKAARAAKLKIVPTMDTPGLTKQELFAHRPAIVALYCSGGTLKALQKSLATAKRAFPQIPTLGVIDFKGGVQQPLPADIPGLDWPCFECYVEPGETVAQMEARLRRVVAGTAPRYDWLGLIQQSYDRHGTTPAADLAALQAVPLRIAKDVPKVRIILTFAARRADGLTKFPELQVLQDKGFAGVTGTPPTVRT